MTAETNYRLAKSTVVEPLVNLWPAWSHLIPPGPSSLYLQHFQGEVLRSYLKDPQVHVKTCANPKLRSGPFVNLPAERAGEVEEFLARTEAKLRKNLDFAKSFIEFQNQLVKEATGLALEPFYEKLPVPLRGYVELLYDYYHRPTVRLLENLLYESPYYRRDLQSFRLFQLRSDDSRGFFMSTPRLPAAGEIDWAVPFDDERVDEFFKLESVPRPLGYIRELLGLSQSDERLLLPFLTDKPAPAREKWSGADVRVRNFGHACVLVEWNGVSILTDPCIGVTPTAPGLERFSFDDLPEKIDFVLVTHNHHDHYSLETLLRIRHRIGCLVVPRSFGLVCGDISLKLLSKKIGFPRVVELDMMESLDFPGGRIIGIPFLGEHADLPHGKTAYVVRAGNQQMLFAADSDCLDRRMYENVRRAIGPIQTVFIGMECVGAPLSWSCGPFFPGKAEHRIEQSRRYKGSDSTDALTILDAVGARRTHLYAMGLEPWYEHLLGLAYEDDSTQITEARKYLARTSERDSTEASLLYGRSEIFIPTDTARAQQLAYWRQRLSGDWPKLELPFAKPRAAAQSITVTSQAFELPFDLYTRLQDLSRSEGVSLFVTLLAAWQALLFLYTGQDDLLIGAPAVADGGAVASHEQPGNTLVLRTDLSGNPTFEALMRRVEDVVSEAFAHREVTLEELCEGLRLTQAGERAPRLQVTFELSDERTGASDGGHSLTSDAEARGVMDACDLRLLMEEGARGLKGKLVYAAEVVPADAAAQMTEQFMTLLEHVSAQPSARLFDLALETDEEDYAAAAHAFAGNEQAEEQFIFD